MDNAAAGDYAGAISAALARRNMAQAETWLRQALSRFPSDPQVLGLAARFEHARGNNERAADYWPRCAGRHASGRSVKSLDSVVGAPGVSYPAPAPGDTKAVARSAPRAIGEQGCRHCPRTAFSSSHVRWV